MHQLKETTIDGVKFVLIPEELHDKLASFVGNCGDVTKFEDVVDSWKAYDPEIFNGL